MTNGGDCAENMNLILLADLLDVGQNQMWIGLTLLETFWSSDHTRDNQTEN